MVTLEVLSGKSSHFFQRLLMFGEKIARKWGSWSDAQGSFSARETEDYDNQELIASPGGPHVPVRLANKCPSSTFCHNA